MATGNTPGQTNELLPTVEKQVLTVTQPSTIASLLDTLTVIDRMSERMSEDRSGDMGGAGGQQKGGQAGTQGKQVSPRDQAIANLPAQEVMQQKLVQKIHQEVKKLNRQISSLSTAQAGGAHKLNKLYARIRRLNNLLAEILEASYEILRRFFIRVFVDEQAIL